MKLLDKLRPQPKIKHADPAVRLEGLQELDDAEQATLIQLATDDGDARVRRAASGRLTDATALAGIVRNESDASARDHALARLVSLAEQSDERAGLSAITALAALGRQRELANTARVSRFESVRRSAVEQVSDQKALGGIARHAADAGTRLLATGRITDQAELEAVASRGEHADAAVDALDRLATPSDDTLNGLIQRARIKAVQKRARTLLRAREDAARPVEQVTTIEFKEADQQRARELADQMDAIGSASDIASVRETYAALRVAWVELLADADVRPETVERFERLSDRVREQLAAHEAARAEAERLAQAIAREQAERAAICADLEGLAGDDVVDRLAAARASWEGMPPMPESWAASLQERFDAACRAAQRRHERVVAAKALAEQAPDVVTQIESLAGAEDYNADPLAVVRAAEAVADHRS